MIIGAIGRAHSGLASGAHAATCPIGRGGGTTKTRIVFRDILRDKDLVFCVSYSLTNHATQPSHPEESDRAHRLWARPEHVFDFSSNDRRSLVLSRRCVSAGLSCSSAPAAMESKKSVRNALHYISTPCRLA